MKLLVAAILVLLAGCAAPSARSTPAGAAFTGEVWTWDEQTSVVTLRQGGNLVRVKVTPTQIAGLQLHAVTTVRGELAGPADLPVTEIPPPVLVPAGSPDETEVTGSVQAVDPKGSLAVSSPHGPLQVWVTANTTFKQGDSVRVQMHVQPLEAVPATSPQAMAPPPPKVTPGPAPGDYAVVVGPITAVDPRGHLTIDSPRGPVVVWVPYPARYKVGQGVELRTAVHPAR